MDWLQFSLALCMAFIGLEVIASGLRASPRDLSWLAAWAVIWFAMTVIIGGARLLNHLEDSTGFYLFP